MARPGRPPVPTELKRARGNPGKRSLPAVGEVVPLARADGPVEPIRELGPTGRLLWDRLWTAGLRWISPTTDLELMQMLCETLDERNALRIHVLRQGAAATPKDRGALRQIDRQLLEMLSLLGFTPTDRARLGLAEVIAETKLQELRRGRERRY